jgi:hypothetical protein
LAQNRNAIKNALVARLNNVVFPRPVNGSNIWVPQAFPRRLKMFSAIDPSAQPCYFLVQHREQYINRGVGTLSQVYLDMGVWCYASTADESAIGDDFLDSMLEGVENVLGPDDPQRNELTLGGLAYWVRIMREDNAFIRDPGDIDGQALLVLPIRILITGAMIS